MRKILFTLVLLATTVSAYSQLLNWNATQNKANSISPKGDANGDGEVDISDVVFVVNEILSGDSYQESCDVNGDGYVDISDVVSLVNTILNGTGTGSDDNSQVYLSCPDENHPHMIDLGLPSGTKWACCNEGASTPEAYGGYYTFGQVSSAPSRDQIIELLVYCSYQWTTQNGVYGGKFTGPNGGTIFLPAAGWVWYGEPSNVGTLGWYWSSTPDGELYASSLLFDSIAANWDDRGSHRDFGQSVRPVRKN